MEIPSKPPCDPAIPLLGIYPEETKTEKTDTQTPVPTAALPTTAGTWKQPRRPLTDRRVEEQWQRHHSMSLSHQGHSCASPEDSGVSLEPVIQSGVGQKERDARHMLLHAHRVQRDGTEGCISRAAMEKQT